MSACEALVFFQDRHPHCDFPGFELFLLFTLCCHGDGEITDVKSWNPGPPATFSLCLVWSGLLFTLSAEPRVCYTEVSNEDSGLRNKVKLHSTSRHMFSTRWVILLESKVGLMKTQRLTAVHRFFSLVGNRMMPQNKAPIHRSSQPLKKRDSSKWFQPWSARKQSAWGAPGCRHHPWWMFAGYQGTKREVAQNEIGLRAKIILVSYHPEQRL